MAILNNSDNNKNNSSYNNTNRDINGNINMHQQQSRQMRRNYRSYANGILSLYEEGDLDYVLTTSCRGVDNNPIQQTQIINQLMEYLNLLDEKYYVSISENGQLLFQKRSSCGVVPVNDFPIYSIRRILSSPQNLYFRRNESDRIVLNYNNQIEMVSS